MIHLTDRHLNIPAALARRFAPHDPLLREDMEGEATVALVRAAQAFDGKQDDPTGYFMMCCVRACAGLRRSRMRPKNAGKRVSLDRARGGDAPLAKLLGREDDPARLAEARDEAEAVLRSLPPAERRALTLRAGEGLKLREAAVLMGVTRERVRQLAADAARRARLLRGGE